MLNRTNRTLSANSLRLNLGTRSLAPNTGNNMGLALRIRHAHPFARTESVHAPVEALVTVFSDRSRPASVVGSSSVSPSLITSSGIMPSVMPSAVAVPVTEPVVVRDRDCHGAGRDGGRAQAYAQANGWALLFKKQAGAKQPWPAWQAEGSAAASARMTLATVAFAPWGIAAGG